MRGMYKFAVVVFLIAGLLAERAYGQGGATGAISGIVVNTSGASIADAEIQIMDWLDENGYPRPRDGNQTKLEKFVAEWLEGHGYEASEATIRRHVHRCIGRYRRKIDTPS